MQRSAICSTENGKEKAVIARRKRAEERKMEKKNSHTVAVEAPTTTVIEQPTVTVVEQPPATMKKKKKVVKYVPPSSDESSDEEEEEVVRLVRPKRKRNIIGDVQPKKLDYDDVTPSLLSACLSACLRKQTFVRSYVFSQARAFAPKDIPANTS
eukprot:3405817-Pleurochrysis_carterae.AAC.1